MPSNLTADNVAETAVDLSWDESTADDGADEVRVRRERLVDGSYWPQETAAAVALGVKAATDDGVEPDREYRYRVQSVDSSGTVLDESGTITVTTTGPGLETDQAPAQGWHAEVDLASGETLTPSIIADDADWMPQLKDQPRVRLPVPRADVWERDDVTEQPLRVWKDGRRLPIEEVRTVEREPSRDVIVGVGGTKLEDDVEGVEYPEEDAHIAAEDVIENKLGWLANVDDPVTDTREDVLLLSAGSSTQSLLDAIDRQITATDPFEVFNNEAYTLQTATFQEAEDASGTGNVGIAGFLGVSGDNEGKWSDEEAVIMESGDSRTFTIETEYTIPEGDLVSDFIISTPSDPTPAVDITFETDSGTTLVARSYSEGSLLVRDDPYDMYSTGPSLNQSEIGDLPPGTHEVTIEVVSGGTLYLDFAHFRDTRYSYNTSDTNATNAVVTGWEQYPKSFEIPLVTQTSIEQITAAEITVEMDNTEGQQALGLRNDSADPYNEASNTLSHTVDFSDATQRLESRIIFGRHDLGTTSGAFGADGQTLNQIFLTADLVNTPVLIDFVHSGTYKELLNRIADAGDSIWELRRNADGNTVIEWTQPGQRAAAEPSGIVEFNGRRTVDGSYQRVIAEGKSKRVEGQVFTTNSSFGNLEGLGNSPIVPGTETVYDVGNRDSQYERLVDYELDHERGAVRILQGGSMETSTDYEIDYEYRFQGSYTDADATNPRTTREQFPSASSDRECEQLALATVREIAAPLEEIQVTIKSIDPTRPLVESIVPDQLPFEGPLRNNKVDNEPGQVVISGGSRREVGEVVQDLNDRIRTLSKNV